MQTDEEIIPPLVDMDKIEEEELLEEDKPSFSSAELIVGSPGVVEPTTTSSIVVSGVPSHTTHKQVGDFFSFCGNVTALSIFPDNDDETLVAIITFESHAAAQTSLLLHNAILNGKAITVNLASNKTEPPPIIKTPEPDFQLNNLQQHTVPADQRTQTSVIAGLLGKGYQLSVDTFQKAKEIDQQYDLTRTMDKKWNDISSSVNSFDKQYRITENSDKLKEQVYNKYNELNISQNVQQVGGQLNVLITGASRTVVSSVEYAADAIGNFIETNPGVKQKLDEFKDAGNSAYDQISTLFREK